MNSNLIYSREHGAYYYVTYDQYGNSSTQWANQTTQQTPGNTQEIGGQSTADDDDDDDVQEDTEAGAQYHVPGGGQYTSTYNQSQPYGYPTQATQGRTYQTQPPQAYAGYQQPNPLAPASTARNSGDSATFSVPDSNAAQMPPPIAEEIRPTLGPNLIVGTPHVGWYETLDSTYRMRTGHEAHEFFKQGRVFAMLWAEPAGETSSRNTYRTNSEYTRGRFGETVYSNIRRFVIMRAKPQDHYVYACPITTYRGRGALKPGCRPSEHTIIYFSGTDPSACYIPGEYQAGMTKEPIQVEPVVQNDRMHAASRIRFGKTFPVEWNVKVKEIGKVNVHHMPKLLRYWREEDMYGSHEDDDGAATATPRNRPQAWATNPPGSHA